MPMAAVVCFCKTAIFLCGDAVKFRMHISALQWVCRYQLSRPVVR